MGKKSGPAPPDPILSSQLQAKAEKDAAITQSQLNMVDQFTPYGNLIYSKAEPKFDQAGYDTALSEYEKQKSAYNANPYGGTPIQYAGHTAISRSPAPIAPDRDSFYETDPDLKYKVTQTLSPENQQLLDLTNQAGIKYGETANKQLDALSDRLSQPLPVFDQGYREEALQGIVERQQPYFDRDLDRLETRLANQGIGLGSEAYNRAMDDYSRGINDFRLAADRAALGEAGQLYGLQAESRNQPLNELAAMLTGSQVRNPAYTSTPQSSVAAPNVMDAIYSSYAGEQQRQALRNQAIQSGIGAAAGMGGAFLGNPGLYSSGGMFGGGGGLPFSQNQWY